MDKKLVIGLGLSGLSVANYLQRRQQVFSIYDTRQNPPNFANIQKKFSGVEIRTGAVEDKWFQQFSEIILSPGVSKNLPILQKLITAGVQVIGDVELFVRENPHARICAITGSNAKSTVTTLVTNMAEKAGVDVKMGGNIGVPVLDLTEQKEAELYVLEISSFQLETTYSLRARAATILNISPDHMDRYDSLADYIAAKQTIYHHCQTAVVNKNDNNTWPDTLDYKSKLYFTLQTPEDNEFGIIKQANELFLAKGKQKLLPVKALYLSGKHHCENALAALALGEACGLPIEAMLATLKTFKGLRHRCQLIAEKNSVRWYNDSKGTNEGATKAAIDSVGDASAGKIILLAGGLAKGSDFKILIESVTNYVSEMIVFGEAKQQLQTTFSAYTRVSMVQHFDEAVKLAQQLANPGDAVLLSPACASFDMFDNFNHRGEVFENLVSELE